MPNASTLRSLANQDLGYWLVLDGFPSSFVSDSLYNLEGNSWATGSSGEIYAPVTASLRNDFNLTNRLDMRAGIIQDSTVTFRLWDKTGELIPYFMRSIDENATELAGTSIVMPAENAQLVQTEEGENLNDKNIGHERIGPSGERHYYPGYFQFRPGLEHYGSHPGVGLPAAVVSDYPLVNDGRRVFLYEIHRDHVTSPGNVLGGTGAGTWRPPTEARLIWFGTITGAGTNLGAIDELEIQCAGPSSWLKKQLSQEQSDKPLPVEIVKQDLTDAEKKIGIAFEHVLFDPRELVGPIQKDLQSSTATNNPNLIKFFVDWSHTISLNISDNPTKAQVCTAIKSILDTYATSSMDPPEVFQNHYQLEEDGDNNDDGYLYGPAADVTFLDIDGTDDAIEYDLTSDAIFSLRVPSIGDGWKSTYFGFDINTRAVVMPQIRISLHQKVWQIMGYDLFSQYASYFNDDEDGIAEEYGISMQVTDDVGFSGHNGWDVHHGSVKFGNPPTDGYLTAYIHTCIPSMERGGGWSDNQLAQVEPRTGVINAINTGNPNAITNEGNTRSFKPLYPNGFGYLGTDLTVGKVQEIKFQEGTGYSRGQLNRPPLAEPGDNTQPYDPDTATAVNRRGNFLLYGKNNHFSLPEPLDEYQIIEASWANPSSNEFRISSNLLVVHGFRDPKAFGVNNLKLFIPWPLINKNNNVEDDELVYAVPVSWMYDHLTINLDTAPRLDLVLQRILCTTGDNPSWTNYHGVGLPAATFTAGDNDNAADAATDCDYASYGLAIPTDMIASASEWKSVIQELPEQLQYARLYWKGALDLEPVFKGICQSRGLAFSLHNKKFSIFDYTKTPNLEDGDVTVITTSMMADPNYMHVPRQELRENAPIDYVELDYNYHIGKDQFDDNYKYKSRDRSAVYRVANRTLKISDRTLTKDLNFLPDFRKQMKKVTNFWERKHGIVTVHLQSRYGLNLDVGSKVALTDPRVRGSTGARNVTLFAGRVISWAFNANTQVVTLEIMLYAEGQIAKRYAPFARVRGYDDNNNRLYLYDDFLEVGNNRIDAGYWTEPAYLSGSYGGYAEIQIWQRIGRSDTWESVGTANVLSTNTEENNSYLTLVSGSISGYLRDRDTFVFLANHGTQDAAYVRNIYAVTTNESGSYSGTKQSRWLDS